MPDKKKISKDPLPLRLIRKILPVMESTIPFAARKLTDRFFFTPVTYPFPSYEMPYIEKAITEELLFEGTNINIYQWGNIESDKKVLLVHGWAGRATQFRVIIDVLIANDFHIISYDAPGHGKSRGKTTDLPQLARIIKIINDRFAAKKIIGHSMGGAACLYAVIKNYIKVDRLVMVSAPTDAGTLLNDFLYKINGSKKLKQHLVDEISTRFKHPLEYYFANELLPNENTPATLALHDVDDKEVGINHLYFLKQNINDIKTFTTQGLGHNKILRDDAAIAQILNFL